MKLTLSVIKADIGSIGGHLAPSDELFHTVRRRVHADAAPLVLDSYVGSTGDDIAILMSHRRGEGDAAIHKLAWDIFVAGTAVAKQQGLYGAGQDLLRESFSGNVRGMGPAVAEMEIEEAGTSWFDGPPLVTCAAFSMHDGRFTEPIDAFAHPFWNTVREHVANKAMEMRRQGFFGAAMLPMAELEYTGITEKLATLEKRFVSRAPAA